MSRLEEMAVNEAAKRYPDATINLLRKEIEHAERRQRERQRHQG